MALFGRCGALVFALLLPLLAQAELRIAVAANFAPVLPQLAELYRAQSGQTVVFSTASTGSLYAQINHGAPFAALLSADHQTAEKIANSAQGLLDSLQTVTCGQLVLWVPTRTSLNGETWLQQHPQATIALANPRTAPYGKAAAETLNQLQWQGKRIQAENIAQAYQFGASGNVDAAFIAHSHYLAGSLNGGWLVPAHYHTPLQHSAVVTRNVDAATQQQAHDFLAFLQTAQAQALLQQAGYRRCHVD